MRTTLLAYIPSPPRGVWHLGPLPIRAYAFFIILGILIALLIGDRRWAARGGERGVVYDIALWMVPFGLIGGRLYHLATDWQTYWGPGGAGFGAAIRIWDGGLGIWGAVALGVVGAWIGCRRRDIPLPAFVDAVAPGVVLAQAIGRLGNYFNQELYGRETTLPWGLEIFYRRDPAGFVDVHSLDGVSTGQVALVVQPTFLYELLWNLLVFAALLYLDRRFVLGHGRLFASYVALYCVGRFGVELLRDDTATHIAGIRINTFTSTFVFIGAVVYIMLAPKGREDPESLRGRGDSDEREPELATVAAGSAGAAGAASSAGGDSAETARSATESSQGEPEVEIAEVEAALAEAEQDEVATEAEPDAEAGDGAEEASEEAEAAEAEVVAEGPASEQAEAVEDAAEESEADEADGEAVLAESAETDPVEEVIEGVEAAEPEVVAEQTEEAVEEVEAAEPVPAELTAADDAEVAAVLGEPQRAEDEQADDAESALEEAGAAGPEVPVGEPKSEQAEAIEEAAEEPEADEADEAVRDEPEVLEDETAEAEPEQADDAEAAVENEAQAELETDESEPAPTPAPQTAEPERRRWSFRRRRQRP
ncbi:prolipoprotein diacylglyceryl transferase [Mycobacterium asiaticum]|uniref:Phosphatidylglycerol--prolipoprotein diacylglyceryl transferase n=1 Tax=Mycobacterium asiaticum TaxID=1790 RepID=A0A1A3KNJ5_MYCAS|nr:prolipoprotein diacylglyceryl transferase [Mycobacterium asiaticum]OBJ86009.1 prolipoprotein diacylglyceryl transferase [Mycobacterium asiaticum]